jgi:cytochrome c oxidase subunit 2
MRKCVPLWSAVFFTGLAWVGVNAWPAPPADALAIQVVAKRWLWKIQHEGGQREINELHLPVGRPVRLTLTSEDVPHRFSVPDLGIRIEVPPGRYASASFKPERVGRYRLLCSRDCGVGCKGMAGTVIVMEPVDYQAWLTVNAEDSPASTGRKLFLKLRCITCHHGGARARGPVLENLYGSRVQLSDDRAVVVDESYLRESILDPKAKVVQGWRPIMPSFRGQVSEEELLQLIAFIRSLKPGQTPAPVEEAPPPVDAPKDNHRR